MIKSIRIFLSSTFLDMQEERDYLVRFIFPKIKADCLKRGISFFVCDLRWGITDAQARNMKTIELCLKQIDRCLPFFIGLLGNRYGWIPEDKYLDFPLIIESLEDLKGHSATEIEFSYYCKRAKVTDNCFFAKKSGSLLKEKNDDSQLEKLIQFHKRVEQFTGKSLFEYESIRSLGERLQTVLTKWIDELFPYTGIFSQMKHYEEMLSKRDEEKDILYQMDKDYMQRCKNKGERYNRFLYSGDSYLGYEYFKNAVFSRFKHLCFIEPKGSEFICNRYAESLKMSNRNIFLYLDSSPELRNMYELGKTLLTLLHDRFPNIECEMFSKGRNRKYELLDLKLMIRDFLEKLPSDHNLLIFIANLHLLNRTDPEYYLSFLAYLTPENVRTVMTTNDYSQTVLLRASRDCVVRNFPIRIAEEGKPLLFARLYARMLENGKNFEPEIIEELLILRRTYNDDEITILTDYLINYAVYDNLLEKYLRILECLESGDTVLESIKQVEFADLDSRLENLAHIIMACLSIVSLDEGELFNIMNLCYGINQIDFTVAFTAVGPFLDVCDYGYTLQKGLDKDTFTYNDLEPFTSNAICQILFNRLHESKGIQQLETAYTLLDFLLQAKNTVNIIRFCQDSEVFHLAKKYDYHLLRRAWMLLVREGCFQVREIYPDQFSVGNPAWNLDNCNFIMKLEHSIFSKSEMEDYLDIPFTYSIEIERTWKKYCTFEQIMYLKNLGMSIPVPGSLEDAKLAIKENSLIGPGEMYILEKIMKAKYNSNSLVTEDDASYYLYLGVLYDNYRLIADAIRYFKKTENPPESLECVLAAFEYY